MGFLAKWLGIVPKEERDGLRLDEPEFWEVGSTYEAGDLMRALANLLPDDANVYFEATEEPEVRTFLEHHPATETTDIALGTVWPRPDQHHMPATRENLSTLAKLIDELEAPLCCHLHAYAGDRMILEWYDAFENMPIRVSGSVEEQRIRAFAAALDRDYKRVVERRPN